MNAHSWRFPLTGSCIVFAMVLFAALPANAHQDLTFTTWTGPYMRSQMLGFVYPYEDETGKSVEVEHYAGGIDEIRNQVESANVEWDVVDLTQADSLRACKEGLLEPIDHSVLPDGADGTPYQNDFIEGALNPCGVGVIVWATIFAYDDQAYTDLTGKPSTIADFFDVKKYPGRRGIRKDPAVIMEWALLADGVPAEQIYPTLETEAGVQQAFARLNQIKPHVVWWQHGRDPIRLLNNGEVAMSSIWATTGVEGSKEENSHYSVEWDGRVIEMDLFGIVKGTRRLDEALAFVKYASNSKSLAEQAKYLANGPARKSSLDLIPPQVKENLPNGALHGDKKSVISDAQWWAENYARLAEQFLAWAEATTQKGAAGTVR
jgi:putative spermidine/putrescine transport system substrate-binding protein